MKLNFQKRRWIWVIIEKHGFIFIWVIMRIYKRFMHYCIYLMKINHLFLKESNIMYHIIQEYMLLKILSQKDFKEIYKNGQHNMDQVHLLVYKREVMKIIYQIIELQQSIRNICGSIKKKQLQKQKNKLPKYSLQKLNLLMNILQEYGQDG